MALVQSTKREIKLEAVEAYWGRVQCRSALLVDDVAGSLEGEYWDVNTINENGDAALFYVLMDTGSAVDPAPAGRTKITVTYTDNDTAEDLAVLVAAALDASTYLKAVVDSTSTDTVRYINIFEGAVTAEVFTNAPSFTFMSEDGSGGFLGSIAPGGITLSKEVQSTELKADDTAELVLGEILQGSSVTAEMQLIEMTKDRWETIVGSVTGDVYTPSGGTRLVGYGESRLFQNLFSLSGQLRLHPKRLAKSDYSEDIIFWNSAPKPASINYSGTDIQGMDVTFVAYLDGSVNKKINLFAQGDWTQNVLA